MNKLTHLIVIFIFTLKFTYSQKSLPYQPKGFTVIGHRGDSGTLPEETLPSFELSMLEGSHYSEFDLVFSKDGQLFVRHEPNLIDTTDISKVGKYEEKYTTYNVDLSIQEGYFINDLTSDELAILKAKQANEFRDHNYDDLIHLSTVEEFFCEFLKANLWREMLTSEAQMMTFNQNFEWEFASKLKSVWDNSENPHEDSFFYSCLKGIDFSSSSQPLKSIDGSEVFSYLKPNIPQESPFSFFQPIINQFFPFGTVIEESQSSNSFFAKFFCGLGFPFCTPYSYFPDFNSAKEFLETYPDPFGMFIELKHSAWFKNVTGHDMTSTLEKKLKDYHMDLFTTHIIVQSFDQTDMVYFNEKTDFPLTQLMTAHPLTGEASYFISSDNSFSLETASIDVMVDVVHAAGPSKDLVIEVNHTNGYAQNVSENVKKWKEAGLKIYPYTFRNEYMYIPFNFNQDPYKELQAFYNAGIDGFITDFPHTAFLFLDHFTKEDSWSYNFRR